MRNVQGIECNIHSFSFQLRMACHPREMRYFLIVTELLLTGILKCLTFSIVMMKKKKRQKHCFRYCVAAENNGKNYSPDLHPRC